MKQLELLEDIAIDTIVLNDCREVLDADSIGGKGQAMIDLF